MSIVVAPEAHGHDFCSSLMFFHSNESVSASIEMVQVEKTDPKEAKEKSSQVFEVGDQNLIYTKSPWVYSRDQRRKDVFHASALERALHF